MTVAQADRFKGKVAPKHFRERCLERGITTTPIDELYQGLAWARANNVDEYAEKVSTIRGAEFWRFNSPDGIFYAVFPEGYTFPATVFTQEIYRKKRWSAKQMKRGKPLKSKHKT